MRKLRVWRRHHGPDLLAEVAPFDGMGTWRACARRFRSAGDDLVDHAKGSFSLLAEAQAAADELLARHFKHRCNRSCGQWGPARKRADNDRDMNHEMSLP